MATGVESELTAASPESYHEKTTYMSRDYQTWSLQKQVNLAPVDDEEESRLRSQHLLLKAIFSDRTDPLLPNVVSAPGNVLDCGFGTGDWACEVAEAYPDCEVVAVDISPIMELGDMPDNLVQEIADLNEPLTFSSSSFDFAHSRFVAGGLAQTRWPSYLTDIKRLLRSHGWVQLTEWELIFRSENGCGDKLQSLREWSDVYLSAISTAVGNAKKSRSMPEGLDTMLRASGFVNVNIEIQDVPTCEWPTSSAKAAIGRQTLPNMESLINAVALYPVTNRMGWSHAEFDVLVGRAREELKDRSARPYLRLYVHMLWTKALRTTRPKDTWEKQVTPYRETYGQASRRVIPGLVSGWRQRGSGLGTA